MKRLIFPIVSAAIVVSLIVISGVVFFKESRDLPDDIIAHDVQALADIFNRINTTCIIEKFEHQRNYIDFFQVRSFVSSQIGSINLRYPNKWEGPYLNDNLMVQDKFYEVVVTKQGYFVVPGEGVRLSNGKVIGKDILLNEFADIQAMLLKTDKLLSADGKPLAVRITIGRDTEIPTLSQSDL